MRGAWSFGVAVAMLCAAGTARAEAGWLTSRGRLLPETVVEAFVGTRSFGAGFVRTDTGNARAGLSFEGVVGFTDRDAELRGARVRRASRRPRCRWVEPPSSCPTAPSTSASGRRPSSR